MKLRTSESAGAIIVALLFVIVLSSIAGTAYTILNRRYRQFHQTASWQEALLAAESGIDLGVAELRKSISDPASAWTGWTDQNGNPSADPTQGAISSSSTVLLRNGEGGDRSWAEVTVDGPAGLVDPSGEQWYRVRSLGTAEVPGGSVAVGNNADVKLRKLDLVTNRRTGQAVAHPQATRLIEAIIKPIGAFRLALMGIDTIDLNNLNIEVDSYDSRDPNKSTNEWYDVNKRQENGDIATNGDLIEAGDAHIYGDASTNGGTVLNSDNVTGEIRDDFYQDILTVVSPSLAPESGSPTSITGSYVIAAGANTPTQYRFSTINLSGSQSLRIQGAADGSPTYAQLVVTGDIALSGLASIVIDPGVYVRIFVSGDADLSGQGILNPNSPLHLQIYGESRAHDADGNPVSPGEIKIAGNGGFRGTVYAPDHDIEMLGGGNADTVYGSFVGWTIRMTGVQTVHYDEALADGGLITDYRVSSWFEDVR